MMRLSYMYLLMFLIFLITTHHLKSQDMYKYYDAYSEVIDYEYRVPNKIIQDARKWTGYKKLDMYTYLHKENYITIGDHDRVSVAIYDKSLKWVETHLYSSNFNKKEQTKEKSLIQDVLKKRGLEMQDEFYTKIINAINSWYLIQVIKQKDGQEIEYKTVILNDKYDFVKFLGDE